MIHENDPEYQPYCVDRVSPCPVCGCTPLRFDARLSALIDAALVLEDQARTVRRIAEEVLP